MSNGNLDHLAQMAKMGLVGPGPQQQPSEEQKIFQNEQAIMNIALQIYNANEFSIEESFKQARQFVEITQRNIHEKISEMRGGN